MSTVPLPPLIKHFPVDTGHKLSEHKTFRRRPGRLLNVLCPFNLRTVSTGSRVTHSFLKKETVNEDIMKVL